MNEWRVLAGEDDTARAAALAGWLAERGETEVTLRAAGEGGECRRHEARKTDLPGEAARLLEGVERVEVLGRGGAVLAWLEPGRGEVRVG